MRALGGSVAALCIGSALVTGCDQRAQSSARDAPTAVVGTLPPNPFVSVTAISLDQSHVRLIVKTNLPTPIAAMASLDLHGQKDNETAIGASKKITLNGTTTTYDLKAVDNENGPDENKPLPGGLYDVGVIVGPKWDENKVISALPTNLEAKQVISLKGSRTRVSAVRQLALQRWVMETLPTDAPWNERTLKAKLGPYTKEPATLSPFHDAYYFPEADTTLIVNRVQHVVSIWRFGKATQ